EGTAVELVDAFADHHAGLLLYELRELARVVLLDRDDPLGRAQDRGDGVRRERLHEPALEEVHFLPLRVEGFERVEDRALRRPPRDDREIRILRSVKEVLLLLRD